MVLASVVASQERNAFYTADKRAPGGAASTDPLEHFGSAWAQDADEVFWKQAVEKVKPCLPTAFAAAAMAPVASKL